MPVKIMLKHCFKLTRVFVFKNEGSKRALLLAAIRGLEMVEKSSSVICLRQPTPPPKGDKKQGSKRVLLLAAARGLEMVENYNYMFGSCCATPQSTNGCCCPNCSPEPPVTPV